jgi:hypothetical protein
LSAVLTDGCPAEVADFADTLRWGIRTCVITTFYGLRSRCTMLLLCISLTPSQISLSFWMASRYSRRLRFFMRV